MPHNLRVYVKEFWSPEKILLVFLTFFSWASGRFSAVYYTHCNYVPEDLHRVNCDPGFIDFYIRPWSMSSDVLVIFSLILVLLPLAIFNSWLKYVASWSIPLGLLLYLAGGDGTGGLPAGGFTKASMLELAVTGWIILLVAFVVCIGARKLWQKHTAAV